MIPHGAPNRPITALHVRTKQLNTLIVRPDVCVVAVEAEERNILATYKHLVNDVEMLGFQCNRWLELATFSIDQVDRDDVVLGTCI